MRTVEQDLPLSRVVARFSECGRLFRKSGESSLRAHAEARMSRYLRDAEEALATVEVRFRLFHPCCIWIERLM